MTIRVKILRDSIAFNGKRLTTLELYYPRFIHSQLLTHRVFSRNSQSSRASPLTKTIEMVRNDPVIPLKWGKNQRGMQAKNQLIDSELQLAKDTWCQAMNYAIECAQILQTAQLHKELSNRILEPFSHINTVISSTEWQNFFALRCHDDAQPEIQELANQIRHEINHHGPYTVDYGEWHLPYINSDELIANDIEENKKLSIARCARVSYAPFDAFKADPIRDLELYEQLLNDRHLSPFEHIATPSDRPKDWANFKGWKQVRKDIEL